MHTYYWFMLDPKSKQDKVKVINLKKLPKLQIFNFEKQGKSDGFESCDWPNNPTQIGFKL